jgi:hypothetical protein
VLILQRQRTTFPEWPGGVNPQGFKGDGEVRIAKGLYFGLESTTLYRSPRNTMGGVKGDGALVPILKPHSRILTPNWSSNWSRLPR